MASFGAPSVIGSTQNKTADQTSLAITLSGGAAVGRFLVVALAKDNAVNTDTDEINDPSIVSDNVGNAYYKVVNAQHGAPGTQAGTACCVWVTQVTKALVATDVVTATFNINTTRNDAQAGVVVSFPVTTGKLVAYDGVSIVRTAAADPADITLGSLADAERLFFWALSGEGPETDSYTIDSDYTSIAGTGTTGGVDATNQHLRMAYRIVTATTDTVATSSDTADRDYAQVLCSFREVDWGGAGAAGGAHVFGGTVIR